MTTVQPDTSYPYPEPPTLAREALNKVPQLTIYFWVIKILATTVGETAADFLNKNIGLGLSITSLIMAASLTVVLVFQFRARRYIPGIYWLAVVLISVVGTLISDNLVDNFGVPLYVSTIVFGLALIATFIGWYRVERTLSVHTIVTTRREGFYWLTILFTFALGTSAGDLISERLGLGYWIAAVIFAAVIGLITAAHFGLRLHPVIAFWLAYIVTRPLGASMGDFMSQPTHNGGLGLGTTITSAIFLAVILALVIYLSITKKDEMDTEGSVRATSDSPR